MKRVSLSVYMIDLFMQVSLQQRYCCWSVYSPNANIQYVSAGGTKSRDSTKAVNARRKYRI